MLKWLSLSRVILFVHDKIHRTPMPPIIGTQYNHHNCTILTEKFVSLQMICKLN
uniref:Uncharacterized protein n=1 Tax=Rhizophora mucronata TaxID=61149 RepID=A0A2P2J087_RHIMU